MIQRSIIFQAIRKYFQDKTPVFEKQFETFCEKLLAQCGQVDLNMVLKQPETFL